MRAGDEAFEELRKAIDELAETDVADLVAEARIEARAKVRSLLVEAIAQELLERSRAELARTHTDPPRASTGDAAQASSGTPADVAAPPTPPDDELAWYVYGVVGSGPLELDPELTGVDARWRPTIVVEGELGAVTSQVPISEFGDETLRDSLNDSAWLEEKARAHESVLDHTRRLTTVIPMRLCTVYRSEAAVRELLAREKPWFTAALARLAGMAEWGVKVFGDRAAIERAARERSPELADLDPEGAKDKGAAYMRAKRLETILDEEVDRLVDRSSGEIHERLSAIATEALVNPLQRPEVAGHEGEMVLNGVYLLEEAAEQEFHRAVASLRAEHEPRGLELVPTGPWPPYNFVKDSIEAAR